MTWRDPRDPSELVPADCERLRELANTYHPFVRYSDAERFFPALAEAWLSHASSAAWPDQKTAEAVIETALDQFRRGTALCNADLDVTRVNIVTGAPNPHDQPIQLEPGAAAALSAFPGLDGMSFLDFGGWVAELGERFRGARGDKEYLFRAFSELAAAINPALAWQPVELMAHLPQFWIPQPPTPTVYCEARWASDFSALSDNSGAGDFPPGVSGMLNRFLVLTYYYLYPAREPSEGEPATRNKEGQWEAISLYFEGMREGERIVFHEPPEAVVISQGSDAGGGRPFATEFRRWQDVHREGTHAHPIVFAARGTHRFFFEPLDGAGWVPGSGGPSAPNGGSYDNNSEFPGWESWLIIGLLIAGILAAIGLFVAAIVVAIIALLIWLFSLIMDLCNDSSENPANPNPQNPETQGDGPQAGDPGEEPAAGSGSSGGGPGSGGGGEFGLPNTGSPSGSNTVSFDVRFINRTRLSRDNQPPRATPYPSPEPCEEPTWWDYSGRWGVRVAPGLANDWASGDQRVDERGRSWGYWHTLRFLEALMA